MNRGECAACATPLATEPTGPVVMDRGGRRYHHACWCRLMDATPATGTKGRITRCRPAAETAEVAAPL